MTIKPCPKCRQYSCLGSEPGFQCDIDYVAARADVVHCSGCDSILPVHKPNCPVNQRNMLMGSIQKAMGDDMTKEEDKTKTSTGEKIIGIVGAICLSVLMIAFTVWAAAWFISGSF